VSVAIYPYGVKGTAAFLYDGARFVGRRMSRLAHKSSKREAHI
jgi:hypothetical protein